ncbi:flavin reductase [Blautia hansenii DSM 20583]|jgi:multimeric flavodoxin WrbA|uniref:Flavin reductase n=2 Tax=Blautia hansenii TaxID=1322 RepID=C9LAZ6_BLAHA|nr:flavin reductase [Blautia hansenii DSM 20583]
MEDSSMKIVIINGSARKGNTLTAIEAFVKGALEKNEIEVIEPDRLHIAPCKGCETCQCYKGCVDSDDTNPTIDKIAAADMILFATPVYWWGMSAQLKLIIDKCYCRGLQLKNKKVGVIIVGGSPIDSIQYELICKQFDCMASYLSWDMLFQKSYYANARDELAKNVNAMKELEEIGKKL